MKYLHSLVFVFVFFSFSTFAQSSFSIQGSVQDSKGEALLFGDVLLYSADSVLLKYQYIDAGHFAFDPIAAGTYWLKINCLGYLDYAQEINLKEDLNLDISIETSTNDLEEVTVKATRNTFVNKNGNLKITIDNSIFANQATTTDVLAMLPGIQLSPDQESISILGKGSPLIYLGKQRITAADLNSIPVESIKDIEIINNPSAKYEAEGRAVILITRIPNLANGYQVSLTENASFKRRFNNYASLNASAKKDKWELKTNLAFNQLQHWESVRSTYGLWEPLPRYENVSLSIGPRPQYVIGGGLYYQLNKEDYISVQTNFRAHTTDAPLRTLSFVEEADSIKTIATNLDEFERRGFFTSNINYNKKMKTSNLFLGLQYSNYYRNLDSQIFNNYGDGKIIAEQSRVQEFQIDSRALRLDFEKSVASQGKLELGINVSSGKAKAFSFFQFLVEEEESERNYDYLESNYAGYLQWSGEVETWSYSAGIRAERNQVEGGFQMIDTLLVDRKRTILFPKVMLNIPLDSTKAITLNYAKTIRRPNYLNASSISTYLNPFLEYTRNVNLKPILIQEWSANFQFGKHALRGFYISKENPNYTSVIYDETQGRIISSPENFDRENTMGLSITSPLTYQFWSSTNLLSVNLTKIQDARVIAQEVQPFIYAYSSHQFNLKTKTVLGINCWAVTDRKLGASINNGMLVLGASVSQTFFKKLRLSVNLNDIFRQMNFEQNYSFLQIDAQNLFFADGRACSIALRYSFGHIAKSAFKNKEVDDNLQRIN